MSKTSSCRLLVAVSLLPTALLAQRSTVSTTSVVRSATEVSSGNYTPSTLVMIENRARTLGDKANASGTRYFAVTDADLLRKKPDELIQRLSPTIVNDDRVRRMEILVDLQRPVTIYGSDDQAANIGTATISSKGPKNIVVDSNINTRGLTVVATQQPRASSTR